MCRRLRGALGVAGAVTWGAACALGATALGARSGVLVTAERPPKRRTASLRPLGYAYWAGSLTAVLALLQGYLDGPQPGFLLIRLGAIAVGGAPATLVAAWPPPRKWPCHNQGR